MTKSLIERMGGLRMTEIRSGKEAVEESKLGPLQILAQYLGLAAYTPNGHRIIKERRKIDSSRAKLQAVVKKTGEIIYEEIHCLGPYRDIISQRRHYNFQQYQDFNPNYNLTN